MKKSKFIKRLITKLVRLRLGLRKGEPFRFDGQKSKMDYYYFAEDLIVKCLWDNEHMEFHEQSSNVSLNWLLNDGCKVIKC